MAGRPARNAPPKGPRILEVALALFAAHGYHATSMDMVATGAGMSKQTLYRYYADKQDLFAQVVRAVIARSPISFAADGDGALGTRRELRELLVAGAEQIAVGLARDDAVGVFRIVIGEAGLAEAGRTSALGQALYAELTAVAARPLARHLAAAHERGLVAVRDPFEAAVRLIAVLKEYFLWPRLLGRSVRPDGAEVRQLVEELVDEFLRAHWPTNAGREQTDPALPARAAAAGKRGTPGRG